MGCRVTWQKLVMFDRFLFHLDIQKRVFRAGIGIGLIVRGVSSQGKITGCIKTLASYSGRHIIEYPRSIDLPNTFVRRLSG